jgi:hypothetical protein
MPNKLLYGDQVQVRLNPKDLEAKSRKQWGELYIGKEMEKGRHFVTAAAFSLASAFSFAAGIKYESFFLFVAFVLGFFALKAFSNYGYQKAAIESWESKTMVRMDK